MTPLLRRILGLRAQPPRQPLQHVRDLQPGAVIQFGALEQPDLSGRRFRVDEVNSYRFEMRRDLEFTLVGEDGVVLHLLVDADFSGDGWFDLRGILKGREVARMFDMAVFSRLFEESGQRTTLARRDEPESLTGWTAPLYHLREDAIQGSFHGGDPRTAGEEEMANPGEGLDRYLLMDEENRRGIMVEVFDQGETDISALLRCPREGIAGMWLG